MTAVPPGIAPMHVHPWALSLAVVVAGLVFGGTGIRSGLEFQPARWDPIVAWLLVVGCSLAMAAVLVRVRDF